jgi:Zn-dependent protease with chaperone function
MLFPFFLQQDDTLQNPQVKRIFDELRKNGLIKSDRLLIPNKELKMGFYACPFLPFSFGGIHYNPNLSNISDNSIRFFLLHEEGHHIKGHYGYLLRIAIYLIALSVIVISLLSVTLLKNIFDFGMFQLVIGIFISMVLFCISTSIAMKSLVLDEFISDIYAAEKIRDVYFIEKPSIILKNAFVEFGEYSDNFNEIEDSSSKIMKIFQAFKKFVQEYHPSETQRLENIKYKFG